MAGVSLHKVRKVYGDSTAVEETSLEIVEGELLALLGPSGCGKTTTLRMIAGFVVPTSGSVRIGDRDVTAVPVHKRNVGMVFQGYALFPHLTVAQNIAFGLKLHGWDKARLQQRVNEMLSLARLETYAERYPKALSGGQQQRVAIARAIAIQPEVLLLDEPLSALDAQLRSQMRAQIRELQRQAGITSVFVTHDQEEAMAIADRIGVMNLGRLEQLGSAQDLYQRPASRFVATFIGKCNLIEGKSNGPGEFVTSDGHRLQVPEGSASRDATVVSFRPENAWLSEQPDGTANALPVTLKASVYLGPSVEHEVITGGGSRLTISAPARADTSHWLPGQALFAQWRVDDGLCLA